MGYGIMAYAVPLKKALSVLGSKDEALLTRLRRKYAQRLKDALEWRPEAAVSLETALGHLLMGEALHPDYHFQYVYAFELLCDYHGSRLPDDGWSGCPGLSAWASEVGDALAEVGVKPSEVSVVRHLMERGLPPGSPKVTIDDYPAAGYLLGPELCAAGLALARANLRALLESEVGESVETLVGWVAACRKARRALICFGY